MFQYPMTPNISKIVFFSKKTDVLLINYQYNIGIFLYCEVIVLRILGAHTDCKLNFRHHVDFLSSSAMKMAGLIRTIVFSFSTVLLLLMQFVNI
jgi:hypothetical protein